MKAPFAIAMTVAVVFATTLLPTRPADAAPTASASGVVGQAGSFTTTNYGNAADRLNTPWGVAIDSIRHRMFVVESTNNRVTVFNLNANNTLPDETADFVIGQAGFGTSTSGRTASTLSGPQGLAYDSSRDRLYVADSGNQRVLAFDVTTISNGMAAFAVIGQADFVSGSVGTTQNTLKDASSVALGPNNQYLFVADFTNRRVMVFDTNSLATSMNATYVLGQTSFTGTDYVFTQSSTTFPSGVGVDRGTNRLYVSEAGSHRVSVFDLAGLQTGMNAIYVIGQPTFAATGSATARNRLNNPVGVTAGGGKVWIADQNNQRVVVFDANDSTNGQNAIAVYGQPDYTSNTANNGGVTASALSYVRGVAYDASTSRLIVTDTGNARLLYFDAAFNTVTVSGTVSPMFTFTVAGRATTCNGQAASGFQSGSSASVVGLGSLSSTTVNGAAQDLSVTSNAAGGFTVLVRTTNASPVFRDSASHSVADLAGTVASPGSAPVAGTEGFGFTSSDTSTPFTANTWAKLTGVNGTAIIGAANTTSKSACVGYAAAIANTTIAGTYSVPVIYTAVPTF